MNLVLPNSKLAHVEQTKELDSSFSFPSSVNSFDNAKKAFSSCLSSSLLSSNMCTYSSFTHKNNDQKFVAQHSTSFAKCCRPHSLEDYNRRLRTFKCNLWRSERKEICAIECARRGFINVRKNVIKCEVCNNEYDKNHGFNNKINHLDCKYINMREINLIHDVTCPWRFNVVSLYTLQLKGDFLFSKSLLDKFNQRSERLQLGMHEVPLMDVRRVENILLYFYNLFLENEKKKSVERKGRNGNLYESRGNNAEEGEKDKNSYGSTEKEEKTLINNVELSATKNLTGISILVSSEGSFFGSIEEKKKHFLSAEKPYFGSWNSSEFFNSPISFAKSIDEKREEKEISEIMRAKYLDYFRTHIYPESKINELKNKANLAEVKNESLQEKKNFSKNNEVAKENKKSIDPVKVLALFGWNYVRDISFVANNSFSSTCHVLQCDYCLRCVYTSHYSNVCLRTHELKAPSFFLDGLGAYSCFPHSSLFESMSAEQEFKKKEEKGKEEKGKEEKGKEGKGKEGKEKEEKGKEEKGKEGKEKEEKGKEEKGKEGKEKEEEGKEEKEKEEKEKEEKEKEEKGKEEKGKTKIRLEILENKFKKQISSEKKCSAINSLCHNEEENKNRVKKETEIKKKEMNDENSLTNNIKFALMDSKKEKDLLLNRWRWKRRLCDFTKNINQECEGKTCNKQINIFLSNLMKKKQKLNECNNSTYSNVNNSEKKQLNANNASIYKNTKKMTYEDICNFSLSNPQSLIADPPVSFSFASSSLNCLNKNYFSLNTSTSLSSSISSIPQRFFSSSFCSSSSSLSSLSSTFLSHSSSSSCLSRSSSSLSLSRSSSSSLSSLSSLSSSSSLSSLSSLSSAFLSHSSSSCLSRSCSSSLSTSLSSSHSLKRAVFSPYLSSISSHSFVEVPSFHASSLTNPSTLNLFSSLNNKNRIIYFDLVLSHHYYCPYVCRSSSHLLEGMEIPFICFLLNAFFEKKHSL